MSALTLAAVALIVADELDAVEPAVDDALADARRLGNAQAFATAAHLRAWIYFRRGRLPETAADAEMVLDAARYGWEPALPAAHALMAMCLLERGEIAAAEAALELPGGEERWHTTFTWNDYLDARGRVRLAAGDARGRAGGLQRRGRGAHGARRAALLDRALAGGRGDGVGGARPAGRGAQRSRRRTSSWPGPTARLARSGSRCARRANLAGGDRGIELLREAADVLAGSPARLEHAHARADLGSALLDGRPPCRRARAAQGGARRRARVRREGAGGARPRAADPGRLAPAPAGAARA